MPFPRPRARLPLRQRPRYTMAAITEPSDVEKELYYYGLPSCPRLVARSDFLTVPWAPRIEDEFTVTKELKNVGSHEIVDIYDSSLRDKIVSRLDSTEWTSIDVVRIGYFGSSFYPVILWIGVTPGSLTSQEGLDIALGCRSELTRAGLDVHCEIREAAVTTLAISVIPLQHPGGGHVPTSLTSVLGGQSIAAEETPAREGTLSVYLSLGEGEARTKCALVSRHVVLKIDAHGYAHHGSGKYVMMPGQTTLDNIRAEREKHAAFWQRQGGKYQAESDACNQLNAHIASLEHATSRRIGHILFSPPRLPVCHQDTTQLWLPDYAIVALDRERFGPDYDELSNTVLVGSVTSEDLQKLNPGVPSPFWKPTGETIRLHGIFTAGYTQGTSPLMVGKQGRTTEMTWGVSNEIRSVIRINVDGRCYNILQWVIVSMNDRFFCRPGDSGSAIWDLNGRIGGIIDGGSGGQTGKVDLTYATPISWILEHIEQNLGPVSLL
ncbi:hypothetical protein MFIFM68171_08648 [Madurella fahalii]|uniref:Uncharacterized protein n=1 Tax=Madurella fahalii TaxID=1157608 RepID=A0ABQ0GKZ9_9PEZI